MLWFALLAATWALFGGNAKAHADAPLICGAAVEAWARGCPAIQTACAETVQCRADGMLLEVGCRPEDRLRVEIGRANPRAFRSVGPAGFTPVGDYRDWANVPEGKRHLLEQLELCLANDPSLIASLPEPASVSPAEEKTGSAPAVPWRLLLGLAFAAAVCFDRWRETRNRRTLALLGGLFTATLALRWLLFPAAFYHPNGQGPFWIGFALDEHGDSSPYGPGFREIFGWLARLPISSPERLVFGAQAVLGAAAAVCAWVIAREVGGNRLLAWGSAAAVATSPLLARMSQSQSYYGTWTSLLFLATAVLVVGCPREKASPRRYVLAVAAAGFLVAQAARVTPIGWMAAAMVPLAVGAKSGPLRAQLRWMAIAALGVGVIVAVTSGWTMLGVLRGSLGVLWLPRINPAGITLLRVFGMAQPLVMALLYGAVVHASQHRAHAAMRMAALFGAIGLLDVTCMVRGDTATFQRAFMAMWAPPILAIVVAVLADLRTQAQRQVAAASLGVATGLLHVLTWREERALPTNVLEAAWAEEWREKLPDGATVLYLTKVGQRVLGLPLYQGTRVKGEPFLLTNEDPLPDLGSLPKGPVYYYESSLCTAQEARDRCRELRERFGLTLVEARTLPAQSSAKTSFFEESTVTVTLFRTR